MRGPWPRPCLAKKAEKQICLGYICTDLVPLDMKWACTCAGKRDVVHTHHDEKKGEHFDEKKKGEFVDRKKEPFDRKKERNDRKR